MKGRKTAKPKTCKKERRALRTLSVQSDEIMAKYKKAVKRCKQKTTAKTVTEKCKEDKFACPDKDITMWTV